MGHVWLAYCVAVASAAFVNFYLCSTREPEQKELAAAFVESGDYLIEAIDKRWDAFCQTDPVQLWLEQAEIKLTTETQAKARARAVGYHQPPQPKVGQLWVEASTGEEAVVTLVVSLYIFVKAPNGRWAAQLERNHFTVGFKFVNAGRELLS